MFVGRGYSEYHFERMKKVTFLPQLFVLAE